MAAAAATTANARVKRAMIRTNISSIGANHLLPVVSLVLKGLGNQPCQAAQQIGSDYDDHKENEQIERKQEIQFVGKQEILNEINFKAQATDEANEEINRLVTVNLTRNTAFAPFVEEIHEGH